MQFGEINFLNLYVLNVLKYASISQCLLAGVTQYRAERSPQPLEGPWPAPELCLDAGTHCWYVEQLGGCGQEPGPETGFGQQATQEGKFRVCMSVTFTVIYCEIIIC